PILPGSRAGDRGAREGDRERELGVALTADILEKYDKNLSRVRLRLLVTMIVHHMLLDRQNALVDELHGLAEVRTPLPHSHHTLTFVL
ncbi:hypothetical protein BD311DRAFT_675754, partial [Dichomitus squalens]